MTTGWWRLSLGDSTLVVKCSSGGERIYNRGARVRLVARIKRAAIRMFRAGVVELRRTRGLDPQWAGRVSLCDDGNGLMRVQSGSVL
ncbi:MAG: hypothetical protein ACPG4T_17435 [Nannocystaceae bacterium]